MGFSPGDYAPWGHANAARSHAARVRRGVTVIAGAEPAGAEKWGALADEVVTVFGKCGCTMVHCGLGTGLVGRIEKGVLAQGGLVKAVVIKDHEPPDIPPQVQQIVVRDYYQRMKKLFTISAGVLVLPGGLGTVAEFTSAAALAGVGQIQNRVVVLDPDGWFDPIATFYENAHTAGVSHLPPKMMWTRVIKACTAFSLFNQT